MIPVEELLQPISEEKPSGADLRYDPVYDAIKEARRQDDELNQGAWQAERKVADLPLVIKLSTEALKKKTKDLQISAWLTDALLRKEGFSGLAALLDQPQMSHSVVMQGAGEGFRIRASVLRSEFLKCGVLQRIIYGFIYLQIAQITQSVLCNRLHEVEARLARALLTSADRMETESLHLTQEFLSQMLGVQRSTVTVAAGELQRAGLIGYSRGHIHILDRPGLTERACECYSIVKATYNRVLRRTSAGDLAYLI